MAAPAMPRNATPSATLGVGRRSRATSVPALAAGLAGRRPSAISSPHPASPSVPETKIRSPARAPARVSASPAGQCPCTWTVTERVPGTVSMAATETPSEAASDSSPARNAAGQAGSRRSGTDTTATASVAVAPIAARSLRLTASAL